MSNSKSAFLGVLYRVTKHAWESDDPTIKQKFLEHVMEEFPEIFISFGRDAIELLFDGIGKDKEVVVNLINLYLSNPDKACKYAAAALQYGLVNSTKD